MQTNIVKYFQACYEADNGNKSLWNIFSSDVEYLDVLGIKDTRSCLDTGAYLVEHKYGEELAAAVATYRREKTLLYCSHFVAGSISTNVYGQTSRRKIYAPLFLFEAECNLLEDGYRISLDSGGFKWNYTLLYLLVGGRENAILVEKIFREEGGLSDSAFLAEILNQYSDEKPLVLSDTVLTDKAEFKRFSSKINKDDFLLIPASAVLFAKRSMSSRGIIDELSMMVDLEDWSAPLSSLFDKQSKTLTSWKERRTYKKKIRSSNFNNVPGLLSQAQQQIMHSASKNILNLLIGPPGTGKSYTIASLALERFMQGESVLVVSQNEHAVDVVRDKIVENFGLSQNAVMRAGVKDYHGELKKYLDNVTRGSIAERPAPSKKRALNRLNRKISRQERVFAKSLKLAERDGNYLHSIETGDKKAGLVAKFKLWLSARRMKHDGFLHSKLKTIQSLQKQREALLANHIDQVFNNKLYQCLSKNRQSLIKFRQALGAQTSQRQEMYFSELNFPALVEAMPIWLCSLNALHRALPLQAELFDLVIIDEATQCDIASCLPALHRAKRALIVGDPKQLRHISFLSRERQGQILSKSEIDKDSFDISYRDDSMVDLADGRLQHQNSVVMLNEHYRSTPNIIRFSNDRFYDSLLRVMTEKPGSATDRSVEIIQVKNARRLDGVNEVEATEILKKLRSLVDEQVVIPNEFKLSIGALSFFREQAAHIQNQIFAQFSVDEIISHKIRSGTPYAFQGEERDIMLISCGVDGESAGATYTYLNRADVFNVSITRARELQLIFLSLPVADIPATNLLNQYLNSVETAYANYKPALEHRDEVITEFSSTFSGMGYRVLLDYAVAGIEMDIVFVDEGNTLAIDLVGFPGEESGAMSVEHYKIFERAGLNIHPVCFSSWRMDKIAVIKSVEAAFVKIKEANTIHRLSVTNVSSHWTKLLATHAVLARNVREIEADLIAMKIHKAYQQLGDVIDQYQKTIWILNEKLSPTELTHIRFSSSSEQVFLNCIDNLSQIVLIQKSMVTDASKDQVDEQRKLLREEQQSELAKLYQENTKAITGLQELALKWSKTKTFNQLGITDMDDALNDLQELSERVDQY